MAAIRKLPCTLVPMTASPDEMTLCYEDDLDVEENASRNCDDEIIIHGECALVKSEGSAWIDSETLEEISFGRQDSANRQSDPE